jgi:hypothetical protein
MGHTLLSCVDSGQCSNLYLQGDCNCPAGSPALCTEAIEKLLHHAHHLVACALAERHWEDSVQPRFDPAHPCKAVRLRSCAGAPSGAWPLSPSPRHQHRWKKISSATLPSTGMVRASRCTSPRRRVLVVMAVCTVLIMRWSAVGARSKHRCTMMSWLRPCAVLLPAQHCPQTATLATIASLCLQFRQKRHASPALTSLTWP